MTVILHVPVHDAYKGDLMQRRHCKEDDIILFWFFVWNLQNRLVIAKLKCKENYETDKMQY